jgi:hypothetical protein
MSADKTARHRQGSSTAPPDEKDDVEYFVRKYGLTHAEAREVVERHGGRTEAAEAAAAGHRKIGG